jgi:SAM-dependent methyltransferase
MSQFAENVEFARDSASVDDINAEFYARVQYPWPPMSFRRILDPDFWWQMLAQDIGSWKGLSSTAPRVWVAGCGTNQALITALKFPNAHVLGTDLSQPSLDVCARNEAQVGVTNLELRKASINDATDVEAFDYILCTGVIHHNSDPAYSLGRLASALRPDGVLELMVYNVFHRVEAAAFQLAMRKLGGRSEERPDFAAEMPVARRLAESFRHGNRMSELLSRVATEPDAAFFDQLLQPVERSFSVDTLSKMTSSCGLDLLTFAVDQFSQAAGALSWNIELGDPVLQAGYEALPDLTRWHISNLMLLERSPMLWFYARRTDAPGRRKSEQEICAEFLDTTFVRNRAAGESFVRNASGNYDKPRQRFQFPGKPADATARRVYEALDEARPIRATIDALDLPTSFIALNRLRTSLATTAFPFLKAIAVPAEGSRSGNP